MEHESNWRIIFAASPVNGYEYREPSEQSHWQWPRNTWLQRRRAALASQKWLNETRHTWPGDEPIEQILKELREDENG